MTPAALLAALRQQGVELTPGGDRLRYRAPQGVLTPELKSKLAEHKPELLALLRGEGRKRVAPYGHPARPGQPEKVCPHCSGAFWWRSAVNNRFPLCYWCAPPTQIDTRDAEWIEYEGDPKRPNGKQDVMKVN